MQLTDWIQDIESIQKVSGQGLNVIKPLLNTGYPRERSGPKGHQDGGLATNRSGRA